MNDKITGIDTGKKRRAHRRVNPDSGNGGAAPPQPPQFDPPSAFPEDAAPILKKGSITKKQFTKYVEAITLYALTHISPDAIISLQRSVRRGDKSGMEMFFKIM